MTPGTLQQGPEEDALLAFLASLAPCNVVAVRTLAHAWQAAGGHLQVGRVTVRLTTTGINGRQFTAATLHATGPPDRTERRPAEQPGPWLEIARVLLLNHGVASGDWTAWSDDLADLELHGFDAASKYPSLALDPLPEANVARLAQALRDLGRLAQGQPS